MEGYTAPPYTRGWRYDIFGSVIGMSRTRSRAQEGPESMSAVVYCTAVHPCMAAQQYGHWSLVSDLIRYGQLDRVQQRPEA